MADNDMWLVGFSLSLLKKTSDKICIEQTGQSTPESSIEIGKDIHSALQREFIFNK